MNTKYKSSFAGAMVRDAMLTDFRALSPQESLADATKLLLAGSQTDFPVVSGGRVVGILDHGVPFHALRERGDSALVGDVMRSAFVTLQAEQSLDEALAAVRAEGGPSMAVMEDTRFAGLLTPENLGEFFMIRHARANPPPPSRPRPIVAVPLVIPPLGPQRVAS